MYACPCSAAFGTPKAGARSLGRDPCRYQFGLSAGWGCDGIRAGVIARRGGDVGAGPVEPARGRGTVSVGDRAHLAARRSFPSDGCSDGDGGCVGLRGYHRRRGRNLGRSGGAGFHGDAPSGDAGRSGRASMLAGAARKLCGDLGGADAVACHGLPVGAIPGRSLGTGRSLLAGRAFQITPVASRRMAGAS